MGFLGAALASLVGALYAPDGRVPVFGDLRGLRDSIISSSWWLAEVSSELVWLAPSPDPISLSRDRRQLGHRVLAVPTPQPVSEVSEERAYVQTSSYRWQGVSA